MFKIISVFFIMIYCLLTSLGVKAVQYSLTDKLLQCKEIKAPELRLACLDAILKSLTPQSKPVAIVPNTNEATKEVPEVVVNTPKASNKQFETNENTILEYTLIKAHKNKKKRWMFYFENGEVWQQNEAKYLPKPAELPQKVEITKGIFESFNLNTSYFSNPVKVSRIK